MPSRGGRSRTKPMPMGPLEAFFRRYSWFTYDPTESASKQFHRLRMQAGWGRNDPEQKAAWEDYLEALVRQFNTSYGEDENDLTAWHALLARVGITNLPDTVRGCKSIIKGKFINLVDLVDARDDPSCQVQHFASEVALSKYTLSDHKIFPRDHIAAGSLLKYLLRRILSPNANRRDFTVISRRNKKRNRRAGL